MSAQGTERVMWVSKWAATDGSVSEVIATGFSSSGAHVTEIGGSGWYYMRIGRDIHETREQAIEAANAMVQKRIKSLQKQIEKLQGMRVE